MTKKPSPPVWCAAAGGAAMLCFPASARAVAIEEADAPQRDAADRTPVVARESLAKFSVFSATPVTFRA